MRREPFRALADRLREPLLLVDPAGVVIAAGRASQRLLGIGEGARLTNRVRDGDALVRYLARASRSSEPLPGSLRFTEADAPRWRCDASTLGNADDPGILIVLHLRQGSTTDARFAALDQQLEKLQVEMRQRRQLEAERQSLLERERQARREAEEANRLKDEFLAAVSHELRTPLHAMAGWLSLLRSQRSAELLEQALEVVDRNLAVQTQIVEDLVDVSRVIMGRMRVDMGTINLATPVRQAVETARPAAESKGLRLEAIVDPSGCVVHADAGRMLQVVWNLLANATKFTPRGGRVQVLLRRANSHAEIVVSDTGEGIARDVLPYVFDRFRQADGTPSRRHGGLGLGLAIVRHLVELHGGVVVAHSEGLGRGATFTVSLPLPIFERLPAVAPEAGEEGPPEVDDPAPGATVDPDSLAGCLTGCRVLLVEDHDDSRDLLARILAGSGAEVVAVGRADAALAAVEEGRFHVIVSDIELPGEDGFTLMRKLRDRERRLGLARAPAIAVTAHTIGEARIHALRSGYQCFLPKPIDPPELVALVQSLCELEASRRSEP